MWSQLSPLGVTVDADGFVYVTYNESEQGLVRYLCVQLCIVLLLFYVNCVVIILSHDHVVVDRFRWLITMVSDLSSTIICYILNCLCSVTFLDVLRIIHLP